MLIYKICDDALWKAALSAGEFTGAEIDLTDGCIHFSTAEQMRETAAKHFAGREGLVVMAVEADALGEAMKWEPSRGGALFPHLYRPLKTDEAAWSKPLPVDTDGMHLFPAEAV